MKHARDHHQLVYHYADGVADILGLSTAQQLAFRTAMYLALREQAAAYEATLAELSIRTKASPEEPVARLKRDLSIAFDLQGLVESQDGEISQADGERLLQYPRTTSHAPATIHANGAGQTHQVEHDLVVEAQPDPTPARAGKDRKPATFKWPTLDDVSLGIVGSLDDGGSAWRDVSPEDKRIIVLATVAELQYGLPPGETLGINTFDRHRPIWMPSFPSLSTSLGMTWKQMVTAATQP